MPNAQSKPVQKQEELCEVDRVPNHSRQNKRRWIHIQWTGSQNSCVKRFNSIEDYFEELPERKKRGDIQKSVDAEKKKDLTEAENEIEKIETHGYDEYSLHLLFYVKWKGHEKGTWEQAGKILRSARGAVVEYFNGIQNKGSQTILFDYLKKLCNNVDDFEAIRRSNDNTNASIAGLSTSSQQKILHQKPTTSSFQNDFLYAPTASSEEHSAAWKRQAIQQSHPAPSKPVLQYVEPTIVSTSNYRPLSKSSVPGPSQLALIKPINASTTNYFPLSNHFSLPQFTNSPPLFPTQQVNDMKPTRPSNFNPLPTFNYSGSGTSAPWHGQIINQTHPAPISIVQQFDRVKPLLYVSRKRTQIPPEMEHIAFQGTYKIEAEGRNRTGNILAGAYYGITINCIARIPNELRLNGSLIDFMIHNYANKNLSEEQWKSFFMTDQSFMSIGSVENENLEEFFMGKAERTKGIDFFSKDLVVLPLLLNNHWMICFVKNLKNSVSLGWNHSTENCEVIIFNSYRSSAFDKWVEKVVRVWLRRTVQDQLRICGIPAEFNENQEKFYAPKNFQNQTDMHSCGVYVILFAKAVFESLDNFMSTEDHSLIDWDRFKPNAESEINSSMTRDGQKLLFNEVISFAPKLNGVVTFEDICEFQKKYPDNF